MKHGRGALAPRPFYALYSVLSSSDMYSSGSLSSIHTSSPIQMASTSAELMNCQSL